MAGYNLTRFTEDLLEKNETRPPSFTVHLHLEHWTLNNGSKFLYNNQIASLLDDIRAHRIPVDFLELFDATKIPFYDGCLIVELLDYRPPNRTEAPLETPEKTRTVLHPNSETLWTDICLTNQKLGSKWSDQDALQFEAQVLLATSPPLCLDPDPHLSRIANHVLRVSTPTVPISLKRKAAALDPEEDEVEKARKLKIMQYMSPRNRTVPSFKILDALQRTKLLEQGKLLMQTQQSTATPSLPVHQFPPSSRQSPAQQSQPTQFTTTQASSPAAESDISTRSSKPKSEPTHVSFPIRTQTPQIHNSAASSHSSSPISARSPMPPPILPNAKVVRAPTPSRYSHSPMPAPPQPLPPAQPPQPQPSQPPLSQQLTQHPNAPQPNVQSTSNPGSHLQPPTAMSTPTFQPQIPGRHINLQPPPPPRTDKTPAPNLSAAMTAQNLQLYPQHNLQHNLQHRANQLLQQQQQQQKQQAQVAATQQNGRATPAIPVQMPPGVGRGGAMNPRISPMPGTPQMQQMHPVQAAQHPVSQMNFSSYNASAAHQLRSMIGNPQLAAAAAAAQQQQQHHLPTSGQPHLLHHQQQQQTPGPGGVENQQPQPVPTPPQQGQMSHQYVYPYGFPSGQPGAAPQRLPPQYWHNGLSASGMRISPGMMPGQPMVTNAQHVQAIQQQLQARALAGGIAKGPSPMPQGNPAMQGR